MKSFVLRVIAVVSAGLSLAFIHAGSAFGLMNTGPDWGSGWENFVVDENTSGVFYTANAQSSFGNVTYSINTTHPGSADHDLFSIDANTGGLEFKTPPDFENPSDSNGDNWYIVFIDAEDGAGNISLHDLRVRVQDVNLVANDDAVTLSLMAPEINVLDNDFHDEGADFWITGVSNVSMGALVTFDNTSVSYYNPMLLSGDTDTFTYTIEDEHGNTSSADVTVTFSWF